MSAPTIRIVAVGDPTARIGAATIVGFLRALHLRVDTEVSYFGRLPFDDSPPVHEWTRRSVVVDDLRDWPLARCVEGLAGLRMAGHLRGLRLKTWLARLDPTVVIALDDDDDLLGRIVRGSDVRVLYLGGAVDVAVQPDEFRVRWYGETILMPPAISGNHARGAATVDQRDECRSKLALGGGDVAVGLVCARSQAEWGDRIAAELAAVDRSVRVLRFEDRSISTAVDGWRLSEDDAASLARLAVCRTVVVLGIDRVWHSQFATWATFAGCHVAMVPSVGDTFDALEVLTDGDEAGRAARIADAKRCWDVTAVASRYVADLTIEVGR